MNLPADRTEAVAVLVKVGKWAAGIAATVVGGLILAGGINLFIAVNRLLVSNAETRKDVADLRREMAEFKTPGPRYTADQADKMEARLQRSIDAVASEVAEIRREQRRRQQRQQ